eukprot:5542080-Prymnesium_polylepis.1
MRGCDVPGAHSATARRKEESGPVRAPTSVYDSNGFRHGWFECRGRASVVGTCKACLVVRGVLALCAAHCNIHAWGERFARSGRGAQRKLDEVYAWRCDNGRHAVIAAAEVCECCGASRRGIRLLARHQTRADPC